MAKNIILGSGLVGLLAKLIMPEDFIVIPFGYSRFYKFKIPLNEDFIHVQPIISEYFMKLGVTPAPVMYKTCFSYGGALISGTDTTLMKMWLSKITGNDYPDHAVMVMATDNRFIYNHSSSDIYRILYNKYQDDIRTGLEYGKVTGIVKHNRIITFDSGHKLEFDLAVSCIPLVILSSLCGAMSDIKYASLNYLHLESNSIDLEGYNQALVVDDTLDFSKVIKLNKNQYVFEFKTRMNDFGMYLLPIIGAADLIQATTINKVLPVGDVANTIELEKDGIYPVGQSAQHDIALNLASTILRLHKLKESWFETRWKRQ